MERFISFIGLLVFIGIALLFSKKVKAIKARLVITGVLLQIGIGILILKSQLAESFFLYTSKVSSKILAFSVSGAEFVFGPLAKFDVMQPAFGSDNAFIFAISVSTTVIFIGALTAVLYHYGIMQFIINLAGKIMQKIMGTTGPESVCCAANIFSGMTESPLVIRPYLHKLTTSELMAVLTGGLATIAGSVFIVYVNFGISAGHLLSASLMSAPAALVIAKIMVPETAKAPDVHPEKLKLGNEFKGVNVVDSACKGAGDGLKLSLNIMAMLVGIIALLTLVNYLLMQMGSWVNIEGLTMQRILGYIFAPFAWLMGVPAKDIVPVGQLLGVRTILNEFVAYVDLAKMKEVLDPRSYSIAIYAICGFANISSIAIQIGGLSILVPERRSELAKLSFYSLIGGTLACFMTACVAGMLI
jgi:concentrative nucleoside transporter, CNT family